MLPADLAGLDAIELGCGTGYVSAWLARRGARPVGIDNSEAQLATARRFQQEFGLEFPLLHGNAEEVPFPDGSFDLAISEYGASIWCDPYRWIPEAARLLRPGGRLVFLVNSVLLMLCVPDDEDAPATDRLLRPYFGMHRFEWPDDDSVEFHLPHGEMIALLRDTGFEVEGLTEIRPPEDCRDPLSVRDPRVGAALAVRRGVEGAEGGRHPLNSGAAEADLLRGVVAEARARLDVDLERLAGRPREAVRGQALRQVDGEGHRVGRIRRAGPLRSPRRRRRPPSGPDRWWSRSRRGSCPGRGPGGEPGAPDGPFGTSAVYFSRPMSTQSEPSPEPGIGLRCGRQKVIVTITSPAAATGIGFPGVPGPPAGTG